MNYSLIRKCDIANGPGVRVSLFVSGCTHHCPGCFQPETWDFNYGERFTDETIWEILRLLEPNYIDGLTILGGEPLDRRNMDDMWSLLDAVRRLGPPEKTVWLYTGSTFETLQVRSQRYGQLTKEILNKVDILVDGPFIETKKDLRLKFCGSSNQRLIDLRKTEEAGEIVLWEEVV
jgi:anaerobic ribonucleoside-triphosphate reductase activating protein